MILERFFPPENIGQSRQWLTVWIDCPKFQTLSGPGPFLCVVGTVAIVSKLLDDATNFVVSLLPPHIPQQGVLVLYLERKFSNYLVGGPFASLLAPIFVSTFASGFHLLV